jgi:hypothetical protein
MKTIVLPVCEKCGEPIEPEACILVDGLLLGMKRTDGIKRADSITGCVSMRDDSPLVDALDCGMGCAYHAACLTKIINDYVLKGALQMLGLGE